jgi:hypothetical protein
MVPRVEEDISFLNIRPKDYPDYINVDSIIRLLYQRLYHKLVEKNYDAADKLRDYLSQYVEIMDDVEGTKWMWRPVC